jgi:hypothetical protein
MVAQHVCNLCQVSRQHILVQSSHRISAKSIYAIELIVPCWRALIKKQFHLFDKIIFLKTCLPFLTGEQLAQNTNGEITPMHVIFSGALGGVIQVRFHFHSI